MARFMGLVVLAALSIVPFAGSTQATVPGANGKIAFVVDYDSVFVVGADGSGLTRIGDGASPAWSSDGRRLALFRRTAGPCAPCNFALEVLDVASGKRASIFEGTTFDPMPAWSPNGEEIAFVHQHNKALDNDIWLVRSDGADPRQLTTTGTSYGPAWSPDGTRLAFYGSSPDGYHLYLVNSNGSGLRELTSGHGVFDLRPSWSPDGRRIAFVSDRTGSFELWVIDADGGGLAALTSGGPTSTCWTTGCTLPYANPSWSPDGTKIVFSNNREGQDRLYVIAAAGGSPTRVPGDFYGIDPDWQPTVDLKVRKLATPKRLRVGRTATVRFRITNIASRDATAVRAKISVDSRLALVSVSLVTKTIRSGTSADLEAIVRGRQPGRAEVRLMVSAAEVDAAEGDNSAIVRLAVAPRAR